MTLNSNVAASATGAKSSSAPETHDAAIATASDTTRSSSLTTTAIESDVSDDLRYGFCGLRPAWLQWMNNIVGAVTFISIANCLQSFANGVYGVVLSTMERQFDLTSTQSSWIAAGYELGPIPISILLGVLGTRVHRPISLSIGMMSVTLGCILFFMPQFTTPAYQPSVIRSEGLCADNRTSTCDQNEESLSYYLPTFIIGRLLIGMGAAPIITIGLNYMDDCSTKEKFAKYCGIFMAMSVIGPGLGFVLGAVALELFTDFYLFSKDELGIDSSDPNWIGCWWLPYTLAAVLCLFNAIPLWGYPRDLPGAAEIRAQKVTEAHKDEFDPDDSPAGQLTYTKSCSELGSMAKSVLTNPTYLALTLLASCDNFVIGGFTAFGPKYFEFGFAMTPSVAGILFGVVLLPAGIAGTVVGGLVIEKLKLTCKQIIKVETVLSVIVTFSCVLFLLICESADFAGVNLPYNTSLPVDSAAMDLMDTCNMNCNCDQVLYEPVCSHDNVQYYSPCHAGCSVRNKTVGETGFDYFDCACITSLPDDVIKPLASSGPCSPGICTEAILFLVGFFVAVLLIFICITFNTSATLRCVTSSQTTFALSIQVLFVKMLGTIPGPVMMGIAFDNTCVLWQTLSCSDERGSCAFYDNTALSKNFLVLSIVVKAVSSVAMILASFIYQPPQIIVQNVVTEVKAGPDHDNDSGQSSLDDAPETKTVADEKTMKMDDGVDIVKTKLEDVPKSSIIHDNEGMELETIRL